MSSAFIASTSSGVGVRGGYSWRPNCSGTQPSRVLLVSALPRAVVPRSEDGQTPDGEGGATKGPG